MLLGAASQCLWAPGIRSTTCIYIYPQEAFYNTSCTRTTLIIGPPRATNIYMYLNLAMWEVSTLHLFPGWPCHLLCSQWSCATLIWSKLAGTIMILTILLPFPIHTSASSYKSKGSHTKTICYSTATAHGIKLHTRGLVVTTPAGSCCKSAISSFPHILLPAHNAQSNTPKWPFNLFRTSLKTFPFL